MTMLWLVIGAAVAALVGTRLVEAYASRRLLDIPNERSSHERPTPRGGGLAIVVAHLAAVAAAFVLDAVDARLAAALAGGGLLVALVGWRDDHAHVSAAVRLGCHVLAFVWCLGVIGGLPPVDFGFGAVDLGWFGNLGLLLYLVWYLNLFNFMDGIDGIAGMQVLCMAGLGGALVAWHGGAALGLWTLAAAGAGFLVWNWPPARIFMGDAGSGYLGFALGTLALDATRSGSTTPWVWLILGGGFLADATVTLVRRRLAGHRFAEAHRSHAYQRLARHWGGHRPVTLAYLAANLLWFGPWAWIATVRPETGAVCALFALVPALGLVWRLGAGCAGELGHGS